MVAKNIYVDVKLSQTEAVKSTLEEAKSVLLKIFDKPQWLMRLLLGEEIMRHIHRLAEKIEYLEADGKQ